VIPFRPAVLSLGLVALGPTTVQAQAATVDGMPDGQPSDWSVLATRASLPRNLANPLWSFRLLVPPPRGGLFWTGGNAAGLVEELDDALTLFRATATSTRGTFRRPLDPPAVDQKRLEATSWGNLTPRFAVLGRVVVERQRFDPGTRADEAEPYPSSPFLTTDTSTTPSRRTRSRLEGVAAWRFGRWAAGLDLGYDALEHETTEAGLVRRSRQAMPGAGIGVTFQLASVRLGAVGRLRHRVETVLMTERAADGQVWQLEGYRDVVPINIAQSYYRRISENVPSFGLGVAGGDERGSWAGFVERAAVRERRTRQQQNDPASDRWDADSWTLGASYRLRRGPWVVFATGLGTALSGEGDLALDQSGVIVTARERLARVGVDARWAPEGPWEGSISAEFVHRRRSQENPLDGIEATTRSLVPAVRVEALRRVAAAVRVGISAGLTLPTASGVLPNPAARGIVYQQLLAPELDYDARSKSAVWGGVLIEVSLSGVLAGWAAYDGGGLSPRGAGPTAYGVTGRRTSSRLTVGLRTR